MLCLFYGLGFSFYWRTKTAHWNAQWFESLLWICLLILLIRIQKGLKIPGNFNRWHTYISMNDNVTETEMKTWQTYRPLCHK